jgi:hypothetical protein
MVPAEGKGYYVLVAQRLATTIRPTIDAKSDRITKRNIRHGRPDPFFN